MATNLKNLVHRFHHDEEGLESLQVVMIIAIAAMIMIAAGTVGKQGVDWMNDKTSGIIGSGLEGIQIVNATDGQGGQSRERDPPGGIRETALVIPRSRDSPENEPRQIHSFCLHGFGL